MIIKFFNKQYLVICVIIFTTGCSVLQSSMTPTELYDILPTMTTSLFLNAEEAQRSSCTCLTKNRNYTAPMGFTVKHDLKNGAKGIDEWVSLDQGNAYVVKNYRWMTIGIDLKNGSTATQLYIEFDTYKCRQETK
jgi:hypothetical protein